MKVYPTLSIEQNSIVNGDLYMHYKNEHKYSTGYAFISSLQEKTKSFPFKNFICI